MRLLKMIVSGVALLQGILMAGNTITVRDQRSFDGIQQSVFDAVAKGFKDITVRIEPGVYRFKQNHIRLCGLDWADVSLSFIGDQCIILSDGPDYKKGDRLDEAFTGTETFLDEDYQILDWFGDCFHCSLPISVVNLEEGLCRVKVSGLKNAGEKECANAYLKLTEWYRSGLYKIKEIRKGYLYFVADDLNRVAKIPYGYNVNYDLIYGQKMPRFRLCNVKGASGDIRIQSGTLVLPEGVRRVHLCQYGCFLDVADVRLKALRISGLVFRGNARNANPSLIRFDRLACPESEISHCSFQSIRSYLFHCRHTTDVHFHHNTIKGCPGFGLVSDLYTTGTRIEYNLFQDTGTDLLPTFCIQVAGDDYYIGHNTFRNFGYSAIAVGIGPEHKYNGRSKGVVEENDLSYDDSYLSKLDLYGLMDSGAIYLTTRNDGAVIRNNRIRNIDGIKDNRGIFCDDGARNFSITGNQVFGIANSYAIDSRRVDDFESVCGPTNVGNTISGNATDSPIRFEGRPGENSCVMGVNYLQKNGKGLYPSIETKEIRKLEKAVKR